MKAHLMDTKVIYQDQGQILRSTFGKSVISVLVCYPVRQISPFELELLSADHFNLYQCKTALFYRSYYKTNVWSGFSTYWKVILSYFYIFSCSLFQYLFSLFPVIIIQCLLLYTVFYVSSGRWFTFTRADIVALMFCCTHKSLTLGKKYFLFPIL